LSSLILVSGEKTKFRRLGLASFLSQEYGAKSITLLACSLNGGNWINKPNILYYKFF
jgi:hypothetical protein